MKIAFVADPISQFNPKAETTSFLAKAFCDQKAECYFVELNGLSLYNQRLLGHATQAKVTLTKNKTFAYHIIKQTEIDLGKMDCVWLRKDPPVDLNFIDHLSLLEKIKDQTLLINNPSGIKMAPEKIFALNHKDLSPQTLISQNQNTILAFIKEHKKVVLKPLNLSGGRGIVIAQHKQESLRSMLDVLTQNFTTYICVQKFVEKAKLGDKRVLLWQKQILGQFLRVPAKNDFRGNMHSGATFQKCSLTKTEAKKIAELIPELQNLGLHFVGIDFLDGLITEVNVTSPMGLGELNSLYSYQSEKIVVSSLLKQ